MYHAHKAVGLCVYCNSRAVMPGVTCEKHREGDRLRASITNERNRQRLVKLGKCVKCGFILKEDFDEGYRCCINCREKVKVKYAISV
jgi:hypothetical protein